MQRLAQSKMQTTTLLQQQKQSNSTETTNPKPTAKQAI